ncbi:MAG: hypothetical protein HF962_00535 [Sulfurovum sp.]|nr:hypothetical protein [Sulfurovum sp.]
MSKKKKSAPEEGLDPAKFDLVKARELLEKEKARLSNAKEDLGGLRDKLETEFKTQLHTLLTEEERDTLDLSSDPVAQWRILSAKHQEFVHAVVAAEEQAVDAFAEEIAAKEQSLYQLEAEARFKAKNPDLDFDAVSEWFEEDMPTRAKKRLVEKEGDDVDALLDKIKMAYDEAHPTGDDGVPDLPVALSGVPGKSADVDRNRTVETPNRANKLYGGR